MAADAAPSWLLSTKASEPMGGGSTDDASSKLDSEQIAKLNLQAAIAVMRSRRPLAALRDVGGSLPSLARHLSRISTGPSAKHAAAVDALEAMYPLVESSRGALTVNGVPLDPLKTDEAPDALHAALHTLLTREAATAAALLQLGLEPPAVRRVLLVPPPAPLRVDARTLEGNTLWLCDVSKDAPFKKWPSELKLAAKPAARGAQRFTRHNLYTATFVVDPGTVRGARIGEHAAELVKKAAPMRVGIAPRAADGAPSSIGTRLAAYAFATGGRTALLALLRSLASGAAATDVSDEAGAGGGEQQLPDKVLMEGLIAALSAKAKRKKGSSSSSKAAAAADTDDAVATRAVGIFIRLVKFTAANDDPTPQTDNSTNATAGIDPLWFARVEALSHAADSLGLPTEQPTVLLNGLVLRAGALPRLRESIYDTLRLEAYNLRPAVGERGVLLTTSLEEGITEPGTLLARWLETLSKQGKLATAYSPDDEQAACEAAVRREIGEDGPATKPEPPIEPAVVRILQERVWPSSGARRRLSLSGSLMRCESPKHSQSSACTTLPGDGDGDALHMVAVVEPLSRSSHTIASVLIALRAAIGVRCTILLAASGKAQNLVGRGDAMPLQAFHSLALQLDPTRTSPPAARFDVVSSGQQTLTLAPEAPAGWMLSLAAATADVDNLQLHALPDGQPVAATYTLSKMLLTGRCHDKGDGGGGGKKKAKQKKASTSAAGTPLCSDARLHLSTMPPLALLGSNGTATTESAAAQTTLSDTLVIASAHHRHSNAGYFQLQAPGPGLWSLSLGSAGGALVDTSGDANVIMGDGAPASTSLPAPMLGYAGLGQPMSVRLVAGGSTVARSATADDGQTVHCFSLASGALYERFLKIMMRSASERSKSPLKFWLLENFLSATFRESIASGSLAKAVGAAVAAVRYEWPSHLRYQTEKQRLIWGYKILFLDVLFPLHVRKIIYIDADQIVQGDVAELYRSYPKAPAPIAMTPFCSGDNANNQTTGFRFWSSGFWQGHLRGAPYHISALFVVDLEAFRAHGVGNNYRDTYQSLTADPNSLSNLDQDLPNYLQHMGVPIHSLPEKWLWCEAWCSSEGKARAQTIDLCNNPLTKEPKLEQAKRIGGERWAAIDAAIEAELGSGGDESKASSLPESTGSDDAGLKSEL